MRQLLNKRNLFIALLTFAVLFLIHPYWQAICFAAILAIVIYPAHTYISKRINTTLSAIILIACVCIVVVLPVSISITYAISEINEYFGDEQKYESTINSINETFSLIPYIGDELQHLFYQLMHSDLGKEYVTFKNAGTMFPKITSIGTQISNTLINCLFIILFLFQFLIYAKPIKAFSSNYILKELDNDGYIIGLLIKTTRSISLSLLITGIIAGTIMTTVYLILGIPAAFLIGIFTGFLAFIPFLLPVFYLLISGVTFLMGEYISASVILSIGLATNLFTDEYLQPKIIGNSTRLNFTMSLLGILAGLQVIGILGIFIGPVVLNLGICLIGKNKQTLAGNV